MKFSNLLIKVNDIKLVYAPWSAITLTGTFLLQIFLQKVLMGLFYDGPVLILSFSCFPQEFIFFMSRAFSYMLSLLLYIPL